MEDSTQSSKAGLRYVLAPSEDMYGSGLEASGGTACAIGLDGSSRSDCCPKR